MGEDHLLLAGSSHIPLVHDRSCSPRGQRFRLLIMHMVVGLNDKSSPKCPFFSRITPLISVLLSNYERCTNWSFSPSSNYFRPLSHSKFFTHTQTYCFHNPSWSDTKLNTGVLQHTQNLIQVALKVYLASSLVYVYMFVNTWYRGNKHNYLSVFVKGSWSTIIMESHKLGQPTPELGSQTEALMAGSLIFSNTITAFSFSPKVLCTHLL